MEFHAQFKKAAKEGDTKMLMHLLTNKKAIKTVDGDGNTPLHVIDNKDIAEMLVDAGIEVDARNNFGCTPLHLADNLETVKFLIAKGADVNATAFLGTTPLHIASLYGEDEVVEVLINSGAKIDTRNENGLSALDMAIAKNHFKVISLIELGRTVAKLSYQRIRMWNLIHHSCNKIMKNTLSMSTPIKSVAILI